MSMELNFTVGYDSTFPSDFSVHQSRLCSVTRVLEPYFQGILYILFSSYDILVRLRGFSGGELRVFVQLLRPMRPALVELNLSGRPDLNCLTRLRNPFHGTLNRPN